MGFFIGGYLVDKFCEPVMASALPGGLLQRCFGTGKGSGAAMMMFILGVMGVGVCLCFGGALSRYTYMEEE